MFNIGAGEWIVLAIVVLVFVGPEQLPSVIRRAGQLIGQARSMSEGLRGDFMSGMAEIEAAADPTKWAASAGSTGPQKKPPPSEELAPAKDEPAWISTASESRPDLDESDVSPNHEAEADGEDAGVIEEAVIVDDEVVDDEVVDDEVVDDGASDEAFETTEERFDEDERL